MSEFDSRPPAAQASPVPRPGRRGALWLWAIAGIGLIAMSLLSIPLARKMAGLDLQLQSLIYNFIYYIGFIALPLCLLARRKPGLWRACRPEPPSPLSAVSIVGLALLGVFFFTDINALWMILLEALRIPVSGASLELPTGTAGLMLCVLYVAVLPAVCEEFLFRGAILPAFERHGTRRAVLISAALFALLHGSLAGLPVQFMIGVLLGYLTVCCDSVYAGLIYHTVHNAAMVLLQFAINRAPDLAAEAEAAQSMWSAVGGLMGLLQLLFELLVLGAMMLFSLRMFRMRARLLGVAIQPPRRAKLRAREWAPLIVGLVCVALLYGADVYLALAGGAA